MCEGQSGIEQGFINRSKDMWECIVFLYRQPLQKQYAFANIMYRPSQKKGMNDESPCKVRRPLALGAFALGRTNTALLLFTLRRHK